MSLTSLRIIVRAFPIPVFVAVFLLLPGAEVYAGPGGFVPCEGTECSACDLVTLIQRLLVWLIGIIFVIFAVLLAVAGFGLVTSGGNQTALSDAKSKFTNALIGIVIVLAAWLMVDTLMRAILPGDTGTISGWGPWMEVQCFEQTYARPYSFGRYALEVDNPDGTFASSSGAGPLGSCDVAGSGPCSESALQAAGFGPHAAAAAQIAGAESGCNPNAESRTDTTTDGRTFSVGTWQINIAAHPLDCNGTTLDCPSAFERTSQTNRFGVTQYRVVDEALYEQCKQLAKDPACNNQTAARLANNSGDMGDWACSAKKCGVQTSRNHLCPL